MTRLSTTSGRLISCILLLTLVLQGVTAASAAASQPAHTEQHCAGHDALQDCSCCPNALEMAGGCAALCSVGIAISTVAMSFPRGPADSHQTLIVQERFGPAYLPLNPPPIS